ncbi:MarR family winged helix-turn-helix transcriptional regulator [Hamadaea tsunoensis]|uniref:MarR family winged helix-turn-helix transcriptional regulator n=1 Tax=Hamadaea tsunoensis TaxID=53368 RepID=UPI000406196D|nr:MarR family transcriptional regulator [Hamadaea tsunoensis]
MTADPHSELYRRLQQIYVLLDDGDRRALRAVGLTPTHFTLLGLLDPAGQAGVTVTRLAELMLCTRGNATRLVQRLVESGLVRTGPDREDQRLVKVYLTETGADRLAAAKAYHAAANRLRFSGLPEADLARLSELAGALADELGKHLD